MNSTVTVSGDQPIQDAYPLAAMQAGMIYQSVQSARSATYHDVLTLTLSGPFDAAELKAVVAELVCRHVVLRTGFDLTSFSEPMQVVYADARLPVHVVDLRAQSADAAGEEVAAWRDEERFRPYDLAEPPLIRLTAHLLPGAAYTLTISFHHAVLDGWSVASLATELLRRYQARLAGRPLPVEPLPDAYPEFVAAERAATAAPGTVGYWKEVLAGSLATRLPREPGRPVEGERIARFFRAEIAPETISRIEELAGACGASLRSALLAVHLHVLSRLTGEEDVVTGTVTHGRPETETGAEVLGLFLNTVAIRHSSTHASWSELVGATHRKYVEMLPHRRFPLVEAQRLAGRSPLFDTAFDFRDFHVYEDLDDEGPVSLARRDHHETTDIPFAAALTRSGGRDGMTLLLSYDETEFPETQIRRYADCYLAALSAAAADPSAMPGAESFTGAGNGSVRARRESVRFPALHAMVAGWAAARPDAVAVSDDEGELTYGQLWDASCEIAGRLTEQGVSRESVVAVAMPRSAAGIAAILGVLQARCTVLPLDLDHPDARLDELIATAGAVALLTRAELVRRFAPSVRTVVVDEAVPVLPDHGHGRPRDASEADPGAAALVLFTSGSTGKPKGVVLTHQAAVHYSAAAAGLMGLDEHCRVAQRSPFSVDAAVAELALAFAAGGMAAVMPTEAVADPGEFRDFFAGRRITTTILVPSILSPQVEAGTFAACPDLAQVLSVGEQLSPALARAFVEQSDARLYNAYGPTEGGIGATLFPVELKDAAVASSGVPIGEAIAGVGLHVLDKNGRPAPVGTPGELYIAGEQLARGYLGQPGLTARTFVPDHLSGIAGARMYRTGDSARLLADGTVQFLGRLDKQMKIRGIRTEPEEIEARLVEHPLIGQAVVRLVETAGAGGRPQQVLVAYVVWQGIGRAEDNELRMFLAKRLPRALVPTVFMTTDAIAMLPNGKADRAALPMPDLGAGAEYVAPRNAGERRMAALWEEVLRLPSLGVRDDFFALGGDSLRALQLVLRIRKAFDRELGVDALLSNPTVEALAALVRGEQDTLPANRVVSLHRGGAGTPVFFFHALGGQIFSYQPIARLLGPDRPVYAIPALGFRDGESPHTTVEEMADDYAARVIEVCPTGPVLIGGYCIGGNIAVEVARRLRETGREVPLVSVFWSHADNPISAEIYDDATLMMFALAGKSIEIDREKWAALTAEQRLVAVVEGAAATGDLDPAVTDIEQARRILRVYRANATALSRYPHAPYDGDLALFKPVEDPFDEDDDFRWSEVVKGRFTIRMIPGRAGSATEEPHIAQTSAIVKELIDSAE
jgi:amino acid adenylation domain-containing protein